MAELLLVVAIIVVLAALAFVGITRYLRSLHQMEMDNAAKQVFYAAQNRITAELNSGTLGRMDANKTKTDADNATGKSADVEYMVIYPTQVSGKLDSTLWDEMLPFGAIDETVRTGGSYIITYSLDIDANMATVLDVWYASDKSSGIAHNWDGSEKALVQDATYEQLTAAKGDAGKSNRIHFRVNGTDAIIGHYGRDDATALDVLYNFKNLSFKLVNDEVLYGDFTFQADNLRPTKTELTTETILSELKPQIKLTITGVESKATMVLTYTDIWNLTEKQQSKNVIRINSESDPGKSVTYRFILDNITKEGERFRDLVTTKEGDGKSLTGTFKPGEDIRVNVEVYSNEKLSNIDSASAVDNSLFQYVKPVKADDKKSTSSEAGIGKVRHLQNLSSEVSGVKLGLKYENSTEHPEHKDYLGINSAQQTADLDWNKFKTFKIETSGPEIGGNIRYNETDQTNNSFHPINLSAANGDILLDANHEGTHLAYSAGYTNASGKTSERKISNLVVGSASSSPDHAGLFGTVEKTGDASLQDGKHILTVEHLIMDNPTITGKTTAAAAVANEAGAVALNTVTITKATVTATDGNAGGAVGKATNGLDLAGVKLSRECTVTASKGNAGGLVGEFDGLENKVHITIREAENKDGSYTHSAVGDDKTSSVKVTGSNTAGNAAGGLVGNIKKGLVTIQNSYSTALVAGNVAGGLVGRIDKCYTDSQNKSAINYSYVGGHTKLKSEDEGTAKYDTDAEKCNVNGNSIGGGFIGLLGSGASEQLTVNGSYTTASASGEQAGGFIGKTDAKVSISNSYAVGLVVDKTTGETDPTPSGAFAGSSSGVLTGSGNHYFQLINGGKPAIAGQKTGDTIRITAAESSFDEYNKFVALGSVNEFDPFDPLLKTMFGTRYFLPTVNDLAVHDGMAGDDLKKVPATHVGDWQPVDTLVINTPSGG